MGDNNIAVRLIVSGRVQGVGFRYYVYRLMEKYPLYGYVRNLPTGQVEVILEGDAGIIEAVIPAIKQGPSFSCVTGIDIERMNYTGTFYNFDVRH